MMVDAADAARQRLEDARTAAKDAVDTAKREADRTRTTVQDTLREIRTAVDWVGGGPASSPEEAERQVELLRGRLERDVRTLRARMPEPSQVGQRTRRLAAVVGIAAVAVPVAVAALKKRSVRRERERTVHDQAVLIARELARLDLDRIADDVASEFTEARRSGNRGRAALAVVGLVGGLGASLWTRERAPVSADVAAPGAADERARDEIASGPGHDDATLPM